MLNGQMLDWKVLGYDLYHIINWFWIFSLMGWIWESSFVSVKNRKPVNRGFVSGPVLTIYGCGAVSVYLLLKPVDYSFPALFFGGVVVATVLEYVTGVLMETIFHANWWDYSNKKFNYQGKICLGSSLGWGFFTLLLFYVLHPFVNWLVGLYPRQYGEIAIFLVTMIYCVDFGMSAFVAFHIKDKLRYLDKTWEEFMVYLQHFRLSEAASYMKTKTAALQNEVSSDRIKVYFEEKKAQFSAYLDRLGESSSDKKESFLERKEEYLEKFDRLIETYLKNQKSMDKITKRYMNAYPHLGLSAKFKKGKKVQKDLKKPKEENEEEV